MHKRERFTGARTNKIKDQQRLALKISNDVGDMGLGMHKLEALAKISGDFEAVESGVPQMRIQRGIGRIGTGEPARSHMISRPHGSTSGRIRGPIIGGCGRC